MMIVKDIKGLSRHSIYVMHFQLVELTITYRPKYFKKREIERSETGAKSSRYNKYST